MSGQQVINANNHVTSFEHDVCHRFRGQMQNELQERFIVFNPLHIVAGEKENNYFVTIQTGVNRYIQLAYSRNEGRRDEDVTDDTVKYIGVKGL